MPLYNATDTILASSEADFMATGQETFPRRQCTNNSGITMTSQLVRLTYFTARKTETSTQVRVNSGNTAAAATPTLCRIGLYTIAANGDATLAASVANDTTLFATTNTGYTKSWSSSIGMVAGQRYALGVLVVTGAAAPTMCGLVVTANNEPNQTLRISGSITGQADLPATYTDAGVSTTGSHVWGVILP